MVAHRIAGKKLGRSKDQRTALLRSLASELVKHERVKTTEAKAAEARRLVEQLITHGKTGTLHHRRLALAQVPNNEVVRKVFDELAPRYAGRVGGYTRVIKLGPRKGDAASMALLELV
jgi:large subunit ribosomal protein L17